MNRTAGPWKACRSNEEFSGPYFEPDEDLPPYPYKSIQSASGAVVVCHDLATIKEGDALLMAASPDLLESCDPDTLEAIANEIDCFHHSARANSLRLIAKKQRAAIAKAEGTA